MVLYGLKKYILYIRSSRNKESGFTLIEVLVAIAVMSTIIFTPIAIISQYITANALTKDRVRAELLAQEIIEHTRYIRDSDILTADGGSWFKNLETRNTVNVYSNCAVTADDFLHGSATQYCTVQCSNGTNTGECGTNGSGGVFNGFVTDVVAGGLQGVTSKSTCDGKDPKDNHEFTSTLRIITPPDNTSIKYAVVMPCISWYSRSNRVRKVEFKEAMFEWIAKN